MSLIDTIRELLGEHRDGRALGDSSAHRRALAVLLGLLAAGSLALGVALYFVFYS